MSPRKEIRDHGGKHVFSPQDTNNQRGTHVTTIHDQQVRSEEILKGGRAGKLRAGPPDPCVIVIFGASGDLARRELIPSLYALACNNLMPERYAIIGYAISDWKDEDFRDTMRSAVQQHTECSLDGWHEFSRRMFYLHGDFHDDPGSRYADLRRKIEQLHRENDIPENVLFHLSTPPVFYSTIVRALGQAGMAKSSGGWRRIVLEKPFGEDEQSARGLDREVLNVFDEEQVFRVDHFLGKETVQNMLVFRFANPGFEPIWNRNYIDNIQITVAEDFGIRSRGKFYEQTGVVRDMVQNHLLQLLCMTTIEPPVKYRKSSLRNETVKVLESVSPIQNIERDCVMGQYAAGTAEGSPVRGYRDEDDVARDSTTPTFAALRLTIDNWRWAGVPIYLRTGKRLKRKISEVTVTFKPTPHVMFPTSGNAMQRNVLTFRLQPDEGILYRLMAKHPGAALSLTPVNMDFRYSTAFGIQETPSAYEWLLYDVMNGDETLFPRADWIYRAWSLIDPIVKRWEEKPWVIVPNYTAGSWGPESAGDLPRREGIQWYD